MGMQELELAKKHFADYEPGQNLGLEGRDYLLDMSVGLREITTNVLNYFKDGSLIAPMFPFSESKTAIKKINAVPYSTLNKFVIRTPQGVAGPMVPYLMVLDEAIDDFLDIDKRLLKPLRTWCGKALANPGHVEMIWLDKNIKFINVNKHIEGLKKHYSDKVGDDISFGEIHTIYPHPDDFQKAKELIADISKESADILGLNISQITTDINDYITRIIKANDDENLLEKTPSSTIAKLSSIVYQAAIEVEFLSVVLFQAKIAATAYRDSIEKINKNL